MEENGKMLTNCVQIFHTDKNGPDEKYKTERITCRGIVVNEGKILISHETVGDLFLIPGGGLEPGETSVECCKREVMEETGVRVKNIRYYKSQPWGIAQDVLMGFFCEADGDCEIRMDTDELKYAEWVPREEIILQPNNLSLTNEMMKVFRDGFV